MMRKVRIAKVDKNTGNLYILELPVPDKLLVEHMKDTCNVGDFLIDGDKIYRRIKGGFREANNEDMAELLSSMISN